MKNNTTGVIIFLSLISITLWGTIHNIDESGWGILAILVLFFWGWNEKK